MRLQYDRENQKLPDAHTIHHENIFYKKKKMVKDVQ